MPQSQGLLPPSEPGSPLPQLRARVPPPPTQSQDQPPPRARGQPPPPLWGPGVGLGATLTPGAGLANSSRRVDGRAGDPALNDLSSLEIKLPRGRGCIRRTWRSLISHPLQPISWIPTRAWSLTTFLITPSREGGIDSETLSLHRLKVNTRPHRLGSRTQSRMGLAGLRAHG